ncbi:MAG: exodeoxyribonuclease I [bacterium]|nr:exodeoxyribonuclease I [bacterium]
MQEKNFFFYDLETFGINPQADRIAQFAGVRTDENFQPIAEPIELYCKIPEDYFPKIEAVLLTGITPQKTLEKGLTEYQFIKQINEELSKPGTCILGYNNIHFDDEFIRNALYRNFFDPYYREWANGNSRWDIINLVRLVHDLRPEGMNWVINKYQKPSFKLEDLTKANGIEHSDAHDALADVWATIALIKQIKEKQPKLYEYCRTNSSKEQAYQIIYNSKDEPIMHTSGMFTNAFGCTTLVYPLTVHPTNKNCILTYDLRFSPQELLNLKVNDLHDKIFDKKLKSMSKIHIKGIHLNKAPIVAPMSVFKKENYERLNINKDECLKNLSLLKKEKNQIKEKLVQVYSMLPYDLDLKITDPELGIYSDGFFPAKDKSSFHRIHTSQPKNLLALQNSFIDSRIPEMLWRFVGRNYSEVLSTTERNQWKTDCKKRLLKPINGKTSLTAYQDEIQNQLYKTTQQYSTLKSLYDYAQGLFLKMQI